MLNEYQKLLGFANPACVRCHGRAVVANTSREFMGMCGMERAYQDFYEEDFCRCVNDIKDASYDDERYNPLRKRSG